MTTRGTRTMCVCGTWGIDIILWEGLLIQRNPRNGFTCELNLLGQNLLISEHLFHDLVAQVHLRLEPNLVVPQRLHSREQ